MRRTIAPFQISHLFTILIVSAIIFQIAWVCRGIPELSYVDSIVGQFVSTSGRVSGDPDTSESEVRFTLTDVELAGTHTLAGRVYVKTSANSLAREIQRGDRVALSGNISTGFGPYVAGFYRPRITEVAHADPPDPALQLRDRFVDAVKQHVPAPESSLALGYLLGSKQALPADLISTLSFVGLTHIVVASGYNLSVLVGFARKFGMKLSRFVALLTAILLIIIFIGITGFSPSMLRAGIVSLLSLITWYRGRTFHPIRILLLAAAITLSIDPVYCLDIGWLLSFASFAGVMLLGPLLTHFLYGDTKPNFIASTILETVAAQIVCLPVILYFFGTVSVISIIPNVLILPTIPYAMLATFITGVTSWLPIIPQVFGFITKLIIDYHLTVIDFFGSLTWSVVSFETEHIPTLIASIAAVILLLVALRLITRHRLHQPPRISDFTPIYGIIEA